MKRALSPVRAWWKATYRHYRIVRREHAKAMADVMIYGTGCVRTNQITGEVQHVPIAEVTFVREMASKQQQRGDA